MNSGDRAVALLMGAGLIAFIVVMFVWIVPAIKPPCDGGHTGPEWYKGHEIVCFHGDVVKVLK
jgi:hypothetical protein